MRIGAALAAVLLAAPALADDSVRPAFGFDLTHRWPEIHLDTMLGSVHYNDNALQGTTYVRVDRLSFEAPLAQSRWYAGVAYESAIGHDPDGTPRFLSGDPEIWARGVWSAAYGLSFGGGFSFVIPTYAYSVDGPAATTAFAAFASRVWDRSLFLEPDNAELRPFLDARLVTGPITVQYRQALEITTDFGDTTSRFAAVGWFHFDVRPTHVFSAGLDLVEYYELEPQPNLADDERAYFAVGAHVALWTRYVQPTIGVLTNIGSPLNAISRIGAPLSVAPASFVGVHFDLAFPLDGVTLGGGKKK